MQDSDIHSRIVTVVNDKGVHARPASLIARTTGSLEAEVKLSHGEQQVDANSVLSILLLAAAQGTRITIEAHGPDGAEAVERIALLFQSGFDET